MFDEAFCRGGGLVTSIKHLDFGGYPHHGASPASFKGIRTSVARGK